MRMWRLTRGIVSLTSMMGLSDGSLLGGMYGAMVALAMLPSIVRADQVTFTIGIIGVLFLVSMLGFASGYVLGMMSGFVLGLASGVMLALVTILAPSALIRLDRYRFVAILLFISIVGISVIPTSLLFASTHVGSPDWTFIIGIPTLIAAAAFRCIGIRVVLWVEQSSDYVTAREGC